ncbi:DUF6612 family protein [Nocardioides ochotonae]|uniref:DUF6612 family protein n=1 Tax=Nocardioides ochotonae TaxID=2685869 RepID=UPI00140C59E2|nr:DUF6612 family protein [Nocardioides ochotonae]
MSRRSLTVRSAAAAALVPLALGSLSACGEDEGEPTKAAAAESSESSESSAEPAGETGDGPDAAPGETVDKDEFMELYRASVEDLSTADYTMDVDGDGTDVTAKGVIDYSSDPAAMEMSFTGLGPGQNIEMVMVDNVMYMKSPDMGEKWVTFDLEDAAEGLGMDFGSQMDMRQLLETFEKGLTKVVYVGETDANGDDADQYRLTVDTKELLGAANLQGLGAQADQVPATMDVEIVFDDDERFRRMDLDMGKSGAVSMSFDNWGTDADIEAPPADETTSMEDLMGSMGGGAGAGGGTRS